MTDAADKDTGTTANATDATDATDGAESHDATFQALSEEERHSHLLLQLVTSMHMGAMYQLGKVASPLTGKVERDLKQAQYTIDLIAMLAARTKGNLTADEETFVTKPLSELRMNFIDEAAKAEKEAASDSVDHKVDHKADHKADNTGNERAERPASESSDKPAE